VQASSTLSTPSTLPTIRITFSRVSWSGTLPSTTSTPPSKRKLDVVGVDAVLLDVLAQRLVGLGLVVGRVLETPSRPRSFTKSKMPMTLSRAPHWRLPGIVGPGARVGAAKQR
jgi:hypothetical protein